MVLRIRVGFGQQLREFAFAHLAPYKVPSAILCGRGLPDRRRKLVGRLAKDLACAAPGRGAAIARAPLPRSSRGVLHVERWASRSLFLPARGDSLRGAQVTARVNPASDRIWYRRCSGCHGRPLHRRDRGGRARHGTPLLPTARDRQRKIGCGAKPLSIIAFNSLCCCRRPEAAPGCPARPVKMCGTAAGVLTGWRGSSWGSALGRGRLWSGTRRPTARCAKRSAARPPTAPLLRETVISRSVAPGPLAALRPIADFAPGVSRVPLVSRSHPRPGDGTQSHRDRRARPSVDLMPTGSKPAAPAFQGGRKSDIVGSLQRGATGAR